MIRVEPDKERFIDNNAPFSSFVVHAVDISDERSSGNFITFWCRGKTLRNTWAIATASTPTTTSAICTTATIRGYRSAGPARNRRGGVITAMLTSPNRPSGPTSPHTSMACRRNFRKKFAHTSLEGKPC